MGIRVQPTGFDVPLYDPFANDKLERQRPAEILTHLVETFDGPCVLAVDAAWGAGKTTFLQMWAQHLRNLDFPVVRFNAWETDFADDPFLALSEELMEELTSCEDPGPHGYKIDQLKTATLKILGRVGPGLVRGVTSALLGPMAGELATNAFTSLSEERLTQYGQTKRAMREFRYALQEVATALSAKRDGRPLVVVIDELDRCRPSYAIELLEIAKHLFAADRVVFVLAVNRVELAHAVGALYGPGFDAEGYLRRFFDLDFRLPAPNRRGFIDMLLDKIRLNEYLNRTQDTDARNSRGIIRNWLLVCFNTPHLSLRTVEQAIHRLGLFLASLRADRWAFLPTATFALILRTIDPDLYRRFVDGKATDEEVAHTIFEGMEDGYRHSHEGSNLELQTLTAAFELQSTDRETWDESACPLLRKYRGLADDGGSHDQHDRERIHASTMIAFFEKVRQENFLRARPPAFRNSVERLELLSPDLVDEESPSVES